MWTAVTRVSSLQSAGSVPGACVRTFLRFQGGPPEPLAPRPGAGGPRRVPESPPLPPRGGQQRSAGAKDKVQTARLTAGLSLHPGRPARAAMLAG
jgi:hypothetical protein